MSEVPTVDNIVWTYKHLTGARVAGERLVTVTFVDGTTKTIDLAPQLERMLPLFQHVLNDDDEFKRMYFDHGTVCWPGDLDLAPENFTLWPDISSGN